MNANEMVRMPAVSGMFYPGDPAELTETVDALLDQAKPCAGLPKALISPHAGYIYSGPVAAEVYACLNGHADEISRVVLLGPAHRLPFTGIAVSGAGAYRTPLGDITIDQSWQQRIMDLDQVMVLPAAHRDEHSLEVQLPFLQRLLGDFELVPLVVGAASAVQVGEVLERLWGGPETLIVISSDLSHYYSDRDARRLDEATSQAILALDGDAIDEEGACGRYPIRGLLQIARSRGMHAELIDLRNSGDTAGGRDRVVGYGAYGFYD